MEFPGFKAWRIRHVCTDKYVGNDSPSYAAREFKRLGLRSNLEAHWWVDADHAKLFTTPQAVLRLLGECPGAGPIIECSDGTYEAYIYFRMFHRNAAKRAKEKAAGK